MPDPRLCLLLPARISPVVLHGWSSIRARDVVSGLGQGRTEVGVGCEDAFEGREAHLHLLSLPTLGSPFAVLNLPA